MSLEEKKTIPRRILTEVFSQGRIDLIDELFHKDLTSYTTSGEVKGTEGIRKTISMNKGAFKDPQFTVEDQIAEGDKVVTRYTFSGTHIAEFMGIAPTGKLITFTGVVIYRIVDGKVIESWDQFDALGMMQQLGIVSMPEQK